MKTPEEIAREIVEDPMNGVCETALEAAISQALKKERDQYRELVEAGREFLELVDDQDIPALKLTRRNRLGKALEPFIKKED